MSACNQGALTKLLVEDSGTYPRTFAETSERYDFLKENIQKKGVWMANPGIVGSRSIPINRGRFGSYTVGGRIDMDTCAADMDNWLPRILGGTESADYFPVADDLPDFDIMIDRGPAIFQYTGCKINRAVFRGNATPGDSPPSFITQSLDIMAIDEVCSSITWPDPEPSLSTDGDRNPYIFADGTLTINGTTYEFQNFVLVIDNVIQPRWVNSLTATALCPQDRRVILRVENPFTSDVFTDLYCNAVGRDGVEGSLSFTEQTGTYTTRFEFYNMVWADTSPVVPGKVEIPIYLDFHIALAPTKTSEIKVYNNTL